MATIPFTCPDCGRAAEKRVGQHVHLGRVVWWGSFSCGECPLVFEEDGLGQLPPGWRDAILAEGGEWKLTLQPVRVVTAVRVLRAALGLSLPEARQVKDRLPGTACSGTWAEMEHLRLRLLEAGEQAQIVRQEEGTA